LAVEFIKEMAKIDALSTRNTPSFSIKSGEILKLKLYSPSLQGLSMVDFQLAMAINRMSFEKFSLFSITNLQNFRKEVLAINQKI